MTSDPRCPIDLDLPDPQPVSIQADNILALQAIYFAALLEGLQIFEVADVLVEHFLEGLLPLDRPGSDLVEQYVRDQPNRLTDRERHALYARAFGMSGGDSPDSHANRQFDDLWARFLVAVDEFVRQAPDSPAPQRTVKQTAHDLAANLSLHGYGIGHFAATELQTQIKAAIRLLSTPSLGEALGARDLWQVIEIVASSELAGAHNAVRYRTMATSGAVVVGWLARRVDRIVSPGPNLLDVTSLGDPPSPSPLATPTDRDLVDGCRSWIAAVCV